MSPGPTLFATSTTGFILRRRRKAYSYPAIGKNKHLREKKKEKEKKRGLEKIIAIIGWSDCKNICHSG